MRFWITTDPVSGPEYIQGGDGSCLRETPSYLEYVYPAGDHFVVTYWLPLSPTEYFVCHCWGNEFDLPVHFMASPGTSVGTIKSAQQGWPTLMDLFANSGQDKPRLSLGVILHSYDPDDGDPKWFIGAFLGNIRINTVDDLFSERSMAVANQVWKLSASVGSEMLATPLLNLPNLVVNIASAAERAQLERFAKLAIRLADIPLKGAGGTFVDYVRSELSL
jgi:hypothetical protein